ncbi:TIGR02444 family protein [Vreelandella malpeensis]|uniref:TIGR02444 family protein n=1 Tax=Vreelandella malpeensis TaxID=1172368 RepID=A0ABS8DST8_9GAMM|nr:TIGR02444 family protein [Halomonas malpeensis]MCB8889359.1 TIGR02444 family protein [Halomonas malpeensis]
MDSNRSQRLQQAPLWDFACAFYADEQVATACLMLQDEAGVDVCELLFHAWLYHHGLEACRQAVERQRPQREAWQREVTFPLRSLRRELKRQAASSPSIAALREMIKRAELAAEKENLAAWQAFAETSNDAVNRLRKRPGTRLEAAFWLQNQVFSIRIDGFYSFDVSRRARLENAWGVLGSRLDPADPAR